MDKILKIRHINSRPGVVVNIKDMSKINIKPFNKHIKKMLDECLQSQSKTDILIDIKCKKLDNDKVKDIINFFDLKYRGKIEHVYIKGCSKKIRIMYSIISIFLHKRTRKLIEFIDRVKRKRKKREVVYEDSESEGSEGGEGSEGEVD